MKFLPLTIISLFFLHLSNGQAVSPYTTCPDVNISIARAGTNADITNPYYLYNVYQVTGAMTKVPGNGFKDPSSPTQNLQINAIGLNKKDGYIYGLVYDGSVSTARFVRADKNYGVTSFGNIAPPVSASGPVSFVNSAAGEMDSSGNYFFSATTASVTNGIATLDKFYLGKISNVAALTVGPPAVNYYEVNLTGANCSGYVTTLTSDPNNSGLKDFSYNAYTKTFFAYVTFKPGGAPNFSGQLLQLVPIAGSNPLKYQLVCTPVINTHTAETSGSLIDKYGKFTILFTDGSFGVVNRNADGMYDGTYTQIASSSVTTLPNPLRGDMASCGLQSIPGPAVTPFTTCPDVNIAVVRAGFNADTSNPYFIYNVNTANGNLTLLPGGPLVYPSNPSINLQVNGVGINKVDGFMYGLVYEGTVNTAKFVRFDKNYGVTLFGNIPPPTSSTGVLGFVNSAAGDIDRSNNFYFTANTANPGGPSGLIIDKLFLGKISNISTVSGTPTPTYAEVDFSDVNCTAYISTLTSDPNNSGIKDLVYSPFTNSFFTYATYKNPGATTFSGQVVELRQVAGSNPLKYKMFCNSVININLAETAGTLIDKSGNFEVLFTNGTIGKLQSGANPYNYTGVLLPLNNSTGLPSVIRGDLASCGDVSAAPLALSINSFTGTATNCKMKFSWSLANSGIRYADLEQSFDDVSFAFSGHVEANQNSNSAYFITLPSPGKPAYYRLRITDVNGRSSYSQVIHLNDPCLTLQPGFSIYPNPVSGSLNLNWYGLLSSSIASISIYDAYGSLLSRSEQQIYMGSATHIDVSAYPAGSYFIKVTEKKTFKTFEDKFVK